MSARLGFVRNSTTPPYKTTFIALAYALGVKPGEMLDSVVGDAAPDLEAMKEFGDSDFFEMFVNFRSLDEKAKEQTKLLVEATARALREKAGEQGRQKRKVRANSPAPLNKKPANRKQGK